MHSASDARRQFAAQANPSARICNAADEVLCASNRLTYFVTLPKWSDPSQARGLIENEIAVSSRTICC